MSYFSPHPFIRYSFPDGKTYTLVDIFKSINIKIGTKNAASKYIVSSSETPEFIANNIYQDVDLSWVINLTNNILNESEWEIPNEVKLERLQHRYDNQKVYSIQTLPDLKKNDIVVLTSSLGGNTFDSYSYVTSWNPTLRAISVLIPETSDDDFSVNTNISFVRIANSGTVGLLSFAGMGATQAAGITTATPILKISEFVSFPQKFLKDGRTISSYYNITGSGNTYINHETLSSGGTNGFTSTLLYLFDTAGTIGPTFSYKSIDSGYTSDTLNTLSIIDSRYIPLIERKIREGMRANTKNNNIVI